MRILRDPDYRACRLCIKSLDHSSSLAKRRQATFFVLFGCGVSLKGFRRETETYEMFVSIEGAFGAFQRMDGAGTLPTVG